MTSRSSQLGLRWCAALVLAPTITQADSQDLQALLDEEVVTAASKRAERATTAPATSTILTAEDMRRYGIRSLADAIDFLSLGASTSDNLSGGEVGTRGVLITGDSNDHILLLVNGHAINEQLSGGMQLGPGAGIPFELIDHIEVIIGPGSVLYGSNAMLGVVNVVTKAAKDYRGAHVVLESSVLTSERVSAGAGVEFNLFGAPSEVTTQVEYYNQDGPAFSLGPQNTGIDPYTGSPGRYSQAITGTGIWGGVASHSYYAQVPSAFVHVVSGAFELDLSGSMFRHATPTGGGDFDNSGTNTTDKSGYVDLRHHASLSSLIDISSRLYADIHDSSQHFITSRGVECPHGNATCDFPNQGTSRWAGAEVQTLLHWKDDGTLITMLGVDARVRSVDYSAGSVNAQTGQSYFQTGYSGQDLPLGAYLEQTWQPLDWLGLNGGARLDRSNNDPAVLSPRLAATAQVWQGAIVKAVYSEAFRAPSWSENNGSGVFQIEATGLRPEKVRSSEASFEQRFGTQRILAGVFNTDWTNVVEIYQLTPTEALLAIQKGLSPQAYTSGIQLSQFRNAATLQNYGIEGSFEGSVAAGQLRYGLNATAALARRTDASGTEPLVVAPSLFGNGHVSYALGGRLPTLALAAQVLGRRLADHALDGGFQPMPYAPPQLYLRTTISGAVPRVRGLSYRLIANIAATDSGPYVVGPVLRSTPTQRSAELNPVDRFRITLGLQYDFP